MQIVTYRISKYIQHLLWSLCILKKLSVKKNCRWLYNFIRWKYALITSDPGLFSSLVSPLTEKVLPDSWKEFACAIAIFLWPVPEGLTTLLQPCFKHLSTFCNCRTSVSSVAVLKQQCKKHKSTSYQHRTPFAVIYIYDRRPATTVIPLSLSWNLLLHLMWCQSTRAS